jgi:RNA polymerase sigma-70 factor (ECF subfamily)
MLGAWRGLPGFEGRSSLRSWLYRISTHAAIKVGRSRPVRQLSLDHGPATDSRAELGDAVMEPIWIEPYPDALLGSGTSGGDPAGRYDVRESVELAFVAALQRLPATQRAVVIIRDVLAFSAADTAELLDTSVASVNSALQRGRQTLDVHGPAQSQQAALSALGDQRREDLVAAFVTAWERADVDAILAMLTEDARLSMPPLPAWFDGPVEIGVFMAERMFATPWRLVPTAANGQLAFGCYQFAPDAGTYRLSAVNLLDLRGGLIAEITAFLDPADHSRFALATELSA